VADQLDILVICGSLRKGSYNAALARALPSLAPPGMKLRTAPSFAAGISLWAASLILVGASNTMPVWLRVVGFVGALLFAVVAVRIFMGAELTPLSEPLPFFAYPLLAATLVGWAWVHYRGAG
jgi:hypothetical protein